VVQQTTSDRAGRQASRRRACAAPTSMTDRQWSKEQASQRRRSAPNDAVLTTALHSVRHHASVPTFPLTHTHTHTLDRCRHRSQMPAQCSLLYCQWLVKLTTYRRSSVMRSLARDHTPVHTSLQYGDAFL